MRLLLAPALLLLLLPASGCREAIVNPLPDDPAQPAEPPPDAGPSDSVARYYLKGPSLLTAATSAQYKAELSPRAVRYEWRASGPATIRRPQERITSVQATGVGVVVLRAVHYDAAGAVVGLSSKIVEVTD